MLRYHLEDYKKIPDNIIEDDARFMPFKLKLPSAVPEVRNKYDGLKYSTLEESKHVFDHMRTIRCVVIKQNMPEEDNSSMFEIFNRLNTGGQNLTTQEIRMSMFYSKFYNMLIELNQDKLWRKFLTQPIADLHFKDIEILLRSLAMLMLSHEYKPSLTRFLNRYSKKAEKFTPEQIDYLKKTVFIFF